MLHLHLLSRSHHFQKKSSSGRRTCNPAWGQTGGRAKSDPAQRRFGACISKLEGLKLPSSSTMICYGLFVSGFHGCQPGPLTETHHPLHRKASTVTPANIIRYNGTHNPSHRSKPPVTPKHTTRYTEANHPSHRNTSFVSPKQTTRYTETHYRLHRGSPSVTPQHTIRYTEPHHLLHRNKPSVTPKQTIRYTETKPGTGKGLANPLGKIHFHDGAAHGEVE